METIRIAAAVLDRGKYSWVWVVMACPYCGKPHAHYGGPLESDPSRYLGQLMTAQCDQADRRRISPGAPAVKLKYVLQSATPGSLLLPSAAKDTADEGPQESANCLEERL
jgi:hypothetical protein